MKDYRNVIIPDTIKIKVIVEILNIYIYIYDIIIISKSIYYPAIGQRST